MYCDKTDQNGVGLAVVSHDSESRTLLDGYEGKGTYERHVHYIAPGLTSVAQLAGLPIASPHCQQLIMYECLHSAIFFNGDKFGWWMSRNSPDMTYWGGATPADNFNCACDLTNSCAVPILVPRGRAPFCQHQESRPLAISNYGSLRFTDFPSFCACSVSSLTNLIGSGLNLLCLQIHSKTACCWNWPEVAILGADQKERGLWGREWRRSKLRMQL